MMGEKMIIERIGTNGDMEKAANLFRELDGKVDAFGLGGLVIFLRFARQVNGIFHFDRG